MRYRDSLTSSNLWPQELSAEKPQSWGAPAREHLHFAAFVLPLLLLAVSAQNSPATSGVTFVVTNTADSGSGSLRQAILDANATNGLDTIVFQIPGAGPFTISPLSALPAITDPVVIDGASQSGFINQPVIEINGASAGGSSVGLRLLAGNTTVRALAINRFGAQGILISGPGTNYLHGNFIGTDVTGLLGRGNTLEGVWVNGSSANVIGGTNAADRNLISANGRSGIYLYLATSSANVVQGNFIGTTIAGTLPLANGNNGVTISAAPGNLVGGASASARNLISGNQGSGIYLISGASGNLVQGNYLGVDVTGTLSVGNVGDGVTLEAAVGNTIGGALAGAGNLIAGNNQAGIFLKDTSSGQNLVQGNLIGTDASGHLAVGNAFAGVTISGGGSNLIGGSVAAARNVISGNKQDGLFITNSPANLIQGNFIGTDVSGTVSLANAFNGVTMNAAVSTTVGGASTGARNIISGNANFGLQIFNPGATANLIQGNYIGTDVTGQSAVANQLSGLRIESPANTVGGTVSGAGNLISGNGQDGIFLVAAAAMNNVVQGNFIGTSASGTAAVRNTRGGIGISGAPANTIGGTAVGAGNLISGNAISSGDAGIYLIGSGATGNVIRGNKIGTDVTGTMALGNTHEGIFLQSAPSNTIGGTLPGAGNLISANNTRGIFLTDSPANVIQGNFIGTKADGISGLGNVYHGIECEAGANNTIIGGGAGAGNRIGFSQTVYAGVRIRAGSTGNSILGNAIFSNGPTSAGGPNGLGIDLGVAGPTANDPCDTDTGANMLQNFPVLSQAVSGNATGIRGSLNSAAGAAFLLQFFASPVCDPTGYGEGQIYLGDKTVVTSNDCNASFVAAFPVSVPAGFVITATATDSANNTSEFSACVPVIPMPPLAIAPAANSQVNLTWTNSPAGLVLKQTGSLAPPIQWTTVAANPSVMNGQAAVPLPITSTNRFFLLSFE